MSNPLILVLEFARTEEAGDPYAFRFAKQRYLIRSLDGGFESVELDWNDELLKAIEALRKPGGDPVAAQKVGETLRHFLEPAGFAQHEAEILAAVRAKRETLITIRSAAAELYALPWELLTLKSTGQHLGELPNILLRFEWPQTSTTEPEPETLQEGGRILFAWSAADGFVPAAEQLAAIEAACAAGYYPFSPQADVLANASIRRLVERLQAAKQAGAPIAVLHLLCHGGSEGQIFGLVLDGDNEDSPRVVVDGGRLRQLLAPFAGSLRLVVLSACDSGNSGALGNQLGSVAQTLHRAGIAQVIASRFPLSVNGSTRLTETIYRELLGGLQPLEAALRSAHQRLATEAGDLDWASLQLYSRLADGVDSRPLVIRPYRGLLAFQPEHRRFFFGRDREVNELVSELNALRLTGQPRFMIVAGASGTGKSSVVLAGAVPELLAKNPGSRAARMRPGADPEANLTTALAELNIEPGEPHSEAHSPTAGLRLLVVDQLEEIFTHLTHGEQRTRFVQRLWQLASTAGSGFSIIATLRVDFIGRCGELVINAAGERLDRIAYDETHRVFVSQLGPEHLRAAIMRPAEAVGLRLEDGLVERMISDVGGEPGALPLLEDTLDVLWQRRRGRLLTQEAYDQLGGVAGALQGRAHSLIESLTEAEKHTARRLLVRLVSVSDDIALSTRRCVSIHKLRPKALEEAERFDAVVERLVDERLLVRTEKESPGVSSQLARGGAEISIDGAGPAGVLSHPSQPAVANSRPHVQLEVAHEALIRKWELLRKWVTEDRHKLLELAKLEQWVRQYLELKTLLAGTALLRAKELAEHNAEELPPGSLELIEKSDQFARARRRWRRWILVSAVLSGIVVLGLLASQDFQRRRIAKEALEEQKLAQVMRDSYRLNAALRIHGLFADQAQLLRETEVSDPNSLLPNWLSTMIEISLKLAPTIEIGGEAGPPLSAAPETICRAKAELDLPPPISKPPHPAHHRESASSEDSALSIQSASQSVNPHASAEREELLEKPPAAVTSDGKRNLYAIADHSALLWHRDTPLMPQPLVGHTSPIVAVALSEEGGLSATGSVDEVRIWIDHRSEAATTLSAPEGQITTLALSADGKRVAAGTRTGGVLIWPSSGGGPAENFVHNSPVRAIAFSPDGLFLATFTEDGVSRIWDLKNHTIRQHLSQPKRSEESPQLGQPKRPEEPPHILLSFSPESDRLLIGDSEGAAHLWLWTLKPKAKNYLLLAAKTNLTSLRFSSNGEEVIANRAGTGWIFNGKTGKYLMALSLVPMVRPSLRGSDPIAYASLHSASNTLILMQESGAVLMLPLVRDPHALRQMLWTSPHILCIPKTTRGIRLNENEKIAEAGFTICGEMQKCMRQHEALKPEEAAACEQTFEQKQKTLYAKTEENLNPLFELLRQP